ncbi:MAG TPA: response regulator [Desulfobulbus sp.]|nr:response regulator [Desulfobulbus sp.]
MRKIRTTSILVLFIVLIFLAVSYIMLLTQQQMQHRQDLIRCEKKSATSLMQSFVRELDQQYLNRMKSLIARNQDMINAFGARDRKQLLAKAEPIYAVLRKENPWLTRMAFFLPDNTMFLQLHEPEKFGNTPVDINSILMKCCRIQQTVSGFEGGPRGLFFHIAQPLFVKDHFVGNLVLGVQVEQFLADIHRKEQLDSAIILQKKSATTVDPKQDTFFDLGEAVLYPGENAFFKQNGKQIVYGSKEQLIHSGDKVSLVFPAFVLRDLKQQPFGSILLAVDITKTLQAHKRTLIKVVLLTLLALLVGGVVLYFGFTSLLNKIIQLNRSLEKKNRALQLAGEQLEVKVREQTRELTVTNENLRSEMSRRMTSEEALRISNEEWRRTFDAIRNPVLILDADLSIIKGNAAALELLGSGTTEEVAGRRCHELFAGSDQLCRVCPAKTALENGQAQDLVVEHSFLGKVFQVSCVPILEDDELLGYVHTARDITIQRNLEQKLVQAQKMEAIATLAGGIAHDFNNILGAILGNADLLLYRFPESDADTSAIPGDPPTVREITEHVVAIKRAGIRAKDLVSQILAFSRQNIGTKKRIVITPVIKEGIKLLRSSLPTTIDIQTEIGPDIGPIDIDPTQIHQILMNLATNAAQALGSTPGRITISLQELEAGPDECRRYHDLVPGNYVVLSVADTGHGIPDHLLKRIFDPFFTTREVGEGTGMGLAVIHGIVVSHGGVIDVSSREGEGAVFKLFFPRADREEEGAVDAVTNMPRGSETILFVDDEVDIVKMRSRMLEYLGYRVFTAGSGREALEIFRREKGAIDLVITDQTMPNMTGLMLAEEIVKIDSRIPIVLCSGYSEAVTTDEANRVGIRRFLAKPLDMHQLSVSIRELLPTRGS